MEKAWQLETEKPLQYISPILPLPCFSVKSFSFPHLYHLKKKKNLVLVFILLFLIIIRLVLGVQVVFIVHLQRENHSLTKANTHTQNTAEWSGHTTRSSVTTSQLPQATSTVKMVLLGMLGTLQEGHKYLFFNYWSKFITL